MKKKIVMMLKIHCKDESYDIEVDEDITAYELVIALNTAYKLGLNTNDITNCYLKTENPICLIKGDRTLKSYGLRNGTIINFTRSIQ
ncbi:MAG: EsaB/YukD family protein [Clostridium sp.]|nr:EsaB/YukD family protein [Clostridium sp.]